MAVVAPSRKHLNSLLERINVMSPPPVVVVKLRAAVIAIGKFNVSRLVPLLATFPVRVMPLAPPMVNALAPELNVMPA